MKVLAMVLGLVLPAPHRVGIAHYCNVDTLARDVQCNYDTLTECRAYVQDLQFCEANATYVDHPVVVSTGDDANEALLKRYQELILAKNSPAQY